MILIFLIGGFCGLLFQTAIASNNLLSASSPIGINQLQNYAPSPLLVLAANKKRKAYSGKVFIFDPRRLSWYAYKNGRLIKSGRASGGKSYCRDVKRSCLTPRGHFRVYSKGSSSCRSSKFPLGRGGAPMPYCTFFRGNYAIHGSPNVPRYNASHGCIRVLPSAARWLHRNFLSIGTRVIVRPY